MFRRKASVLLATLGVIAAAFVAATPAAVAAPATTDATCTGHAGCFSGWDDAYYYDSGYQEQLHINVAVTWYPDNHRRFYFSGDAHDVPQVLPTSFMDEFRLYYKLPGESAYHLFSTIVCCADPTFPPVGSYSWRDVTPPSPSLGYDWIARARWAGAWVTSPGIYN
jgi:hypothetical protein